MSALTFQATDPETLDTAVYIANASERTAYKLYDNGDATFLVTVIEKRGNGSLNNMIAQDAANIEEAQTACQLDWDSGNRK